MSAREPQTPHATPAAPPSEPLPKAYDPSAIEQRWAQYWIAERLWDVQTPQDESILSRPVGGPREAENFTMLLPPPNVTGRLHMGHMLNQTEMDILTRWHRMRGETALWVPGTDHAGIATQMMVERQLLSEGTCRQRLGRDAFVERVWQWKQQYGDAITEQMKRLGASVDWSREYFTMDDRLSVAVKEAFVRLYEQGLIYRGAYIVNWDPVQQTAVSDLEVSHEERAGKLYHIRYPFADGTGSIVIATTRPETMLGDVAVAVNPNDARYREAIGKLLTLPLSAAAAHADREIPVIVDDWASPEFGTGAVKVTPAHDPNDFAIGQRHALPQLVIMDESAHIHLPGSPYNGLDRYAAREKLVADLDAAGLLVAVKDHALAIAVSQRSGAVIEPRLSMQWFLAVNKTPDGTGTDRASIAQNAIFAVAHKHIKFMPEMYEKTYMEWMNNIHDWCISRQLWWGHRIPAWHCAACHAITVSRETPSACGTCSSERIEQSTDVLDTWFSSGLLPFTVFGWPNADANGAPSLSPDLAAFYPTSLLVTGFDILFFWVARMIMLGCHFMLDVPMPDGSPRTLAEAVPFREVYIHALVRDANREKMSKTKGNVIDPIEIITKYGTDAVRFTLASQASPGTDIAFSEARTEGYRAFANKIWNAARFLFMNLDRARAAGIAFDLPQTSGAPFMTRSGMGAESTDAPLESRWIVARLSQTAGAVNASLAEYRFDEAASHVYQFFWGDLCDWYLEIVKLRLNFDDAAQSAQTSAALTTLVAVFEAALRLLSPFMPFLTEEIWHALYAGNTPTKSIALTRFPQAQDYALDEKATDDLKLLREVIVGARSMRKELGVPEKELVPMRVGGLGTIKQLIKFNEPLIARLARISNIELTALHESPVRGQGVVQFRQYEIQILYERQIDVAAERERLTKDLAKYEKGLAAAERQLSNQSFMSRAPAHIVEGLRTQAAETRTLYDKAKAALDSLPLQ